MVRKKPPFHEWTCKFGHSYGACKCHLPLLHIGQDESIYKALAMSSKVWVTNGVTGLRKKTDGPGEMVSAVQDNARGFGIPMSKAEVREHPAARRTRTASECAVRAAFSAASSAVALAFGFGAEAVLDAEVNGQRTMSSAPRLHPTTSTTSSGAAPATATGEEAVLARIASMPNITDGGVASPGLVYMNYGKSKEGYWKYDHFEVQMLKCMEVCEVLHPHMQLMVEVDHSSGHGKGKEGGLNANSMGVGFGGKQARMRSSTVCEGCLGAQDATMWTDGQGEWSLSERPGWRRVDRKLRVGDSQSMEFREGDPPPFYMLDDAQKKDRQEQKQKARKNGRAPTTVTVTVEGYEGKAKGMRQVLWERGLYKPGMIGRVSEDDPQGRGHDMSMAHVLASCTDFAEEESAFEKLVRDRGHIAMTSPKGHPELAGAGIEYSWGGSKMVYRRENDCVSAHLHRDISRSSRVLTPCRARKYARRARTYRRAYQHLDTQPAGQGPLLLRSEKSAASFVSVEKFVKESKIHRCILSQEFKYLQDSLEVEVVSDG